MDSEIKKEQQTQGIHPMRYFNHEVEGKWDNGKYESKVMVTEMTLDEIVEHITNKF